MVPNQPTFQGFKEGPLRLFVSTVQPSGEGACGLGGGSLRQRGAVSPGAPQVPDAGHAKSRGWVHGESRGHKCVSKLKRLKSGFLFQYSDQVIYWVKGYLGHSVAEPDKLGVCFDFTPGKASGME